MSALTRWTCDDGPSYQAAELGSEGDFAAFMQELDSYPYADSRPQSDYGTDATDEEQSRGFASRTEFDWRLGTIGTQTQETTAEQSGVTASPTSSIDSDYSKEALSSSTTTRRRRDTRKPVKSRDPVKRLEKQRRDRAPLQARRKAAICGINALQSRGVTTHTDGVFYLAYNKKTVQELEAILQQAETMAIPGIEDGWTEVAADWAVAASGRGRNLLISAETIHNNLNTASGLSCREISLEELTRLKKIKTLGTMWIVPEK